MVVIGMPVSDSMEGDDGFVHMIVSIAFHRLSDRVRDEKNEECRKECGERTMQ